MELTLILVTAGALFVFLVLFAALIAWIYRAVPVGSVLVVNTPQGPRVMRRGGPVLPKIHRAEALELTPRTLELRLFGREGPVCKDDIRVDVVAAVTIGVRDTDEDILKVAREIGCGRAGDAEALRERLGPRILDALAGEFRDRDFTDHLADREGLRDRILERVGTDLGGLEITALSLPHVSPTPIDQLDPGNILDAAGILKQTRIASEHGLAVAELQRDMALRAAEARLRADLQALPRGP